MKKRKEKNIVSVPKYTERKHSSEQALASQRMPARVYVDKKKQAKKSACRQSETN